MLLLRLLQGCGVVLSEAFNVASCFWQLLLWICGFVALWMDVSSSCVSVFDVYVCFYFHCPSYPDGKALGLEMCYTHNFYPSDKVT